MGDKGHLQLPASDMRSHRRTWPQSKILEYYEGIYGQVYLAHHMPFRVDSQKLDSSLPKEIADTSIISTERKISKEKILLLLNAKYGAVPMTLRELRVITSTDNDRDALRALADDPYEFPINTEDEMRSDLLKNYLDANGYSAESCCSIPTYMQAAFSKIFAACGVERFHVTSGLDAINFAVDSYVDKLPWELHLRTTGIEAAYDEAGKVLVVHEPHNYCTLICGRDNLLDNIDVASILEGFWCDKNSTTDRNWETV